MHTGSVGRVWFCVQSIQSSAGWERAKHVCTWDVRHVVGAEESVGSVVAAEAASECVAGVLGLLESLHRQVNSRTNVLDEVVRALAPFHWVAEYGVATAPGAT